MKSALTSWDCPRLCWQSCISVRRGIPKGIGGLVDVVKAPAYATGVGLVLYGSGNIARGKLGRAEGNFISRTFKGLKQWVLDFF